MPVADLEGPLQDFTIRTKQIREIMVTVEAASKTPGVLTTARSGVDLKQVSAQTCNTANSMALIFLASAFEEFVREVTVQCANYLMDKYPTLAVETRNKVRDAYWKASRDQLRFTNSILSKNTPDPTLLGKVRGALDSLQGFVVNDDASKLVSASFTHHSNNFRPDVVVEILKRISIVGFLSSVSESNKLKKYFAVTKKEECAARMHAKWNEFYDQRNATVHSLGGNTGFAVEVVFEYIEFLELVADSAKVSLARSIAIW